MRVVAIRTVRPESQRNVCFVELEFDDGSTGLGEAFYAGAAVEAYVHDSVAPVLLGLADVTPESAAAALRPYAGYAGSGVETRANGAVDIAIWDAIGRRSGLSLSSLLGGPAEVDVPAYNTCAGARYVSTSSFQQVANWGVDSDDRYEDLHAFLTRPGELAKELCDRGFVGMKVWPFDEAAERSRGNDIDRAGLLFGLGVISSIRDAVGDDIEVMVELHGLWAPRAAERILRELEPFAPYWAEDPLRADNVEGLATLRSQTTIPLAVGETVAGQRSFRRLLDASALDVATVDVGWTGGITEARKVAAACESSGIPVAPHDCTGPVSLAVASHLTNSSPNGLIQEVARAFLHTWYGEVAEGLPVLDNGRLRVPGRPGHGITLVEGLAASGAASQRESRALPA